MSVGMQTSALKNYDVQQEDFLRIHLLLPEKPHEIAVEKRKMRETETQLLK